jgi:hypothetical protein
MLAKTDQNKQNVHPPVLRRQLVHNGFQFEGGNVRRDFFI